MSETILPPHYLARDYLKRHIPAPEPIPTREDVRREVSLTLIEAERRGRAERED